MWGVITTVLWTGASGEAVWKRQVGGLSGVLVKLSFLLKEKVRLEAGGRAGKRQQAERESVQLPTSVASGCCTLGKQRPASHPGGAPAPAPRPRPRPRVWLTTLWASNPPATLWKLAAVRQQSEETLCVFG